MSATVVLIERIRPHPNANRLDLLDLSNGVTLVSGQHYRSGQMGIYIPPAHIIPGWLAEDLWLVKKGNSELLVEDRIIRGVQSPGLFIGAEFQNSRSSEWQAWPMWRKRWLVGDDVTGYLGVRRGTSTGEDGLLKTATDVRLVPSAHCLGCAEASESVRVATYREGVYYEYTVMLNGHPDSSAVFFSMLKDQGGIPPIPPPSPALRRTG